MRTPSRLVTLCVETCCVFVVAYSSNMASIALKNERIRALDELQEMFSTSLDPEVVKLILTESDFDGENEFRFLFGRYTHFVDDIRTSGEIFFTHPGVFIGGSVIQNGSVLPWKGGFFSVDTVLGLHSIATSISARFTLNLLLVPGVFEGNLTYYKVRG